MKRKVAACYLKKGMAYCLMGAMLLGLSIGTAGCGKEQKGTQEAVKPVSEVKPDTEIKSARHGSTNTGGRSKTYSYI